MRWPALLVGTAALLVTGQTRAGTAEDVERAVQAIQAAFNKGDVDALKGLMTEDHVSIMTYAQIYGAASLLKSLGDFKFSEYKISGLKVKVVAKDVALASHEATIKGTYKGREVPSPVLVTTIWVRHDSKWLQAWYQETPVDKK